LGWLLESIGDSRPR